MGLDCSDWTFDSGWKEGEPNHLDIEHCAEYREIGWNNVDCNLWIKEYVCRKGICKGKSQTFNIFSIHIDFEGATNKTLERCNKKECASNCEDPWEETNGRCYLWSREKMFLEQLTTLANLS